MKSFLIILGAFFAGALRYMETSNFNAAMFVVVVLLLISMMLDKFAENLAERLAPRPSLSTVIDAMKDAPEDDHETVKVWHGNDTAARTDETPIIQGARMHQSAKNIDDEDRLTVPTQGESFIYVPTSEKRDIIHPGRTPTQIDTASSGGPTQIDTASSGGNNS